MPKVSVIIPAYNCEAYIARAIQSVFDQHHPDLELIVVDDGSSDATVQALAPFRDRLHLIQQPNAGVAAARNAGLRCAHGGLVAFLDADDWWEPSRLSAQLAALAQFPDTGMVFSEFAVADSAGTALMQHGIRWKYRSIRDTDSTPWKMIFGNSAVVSWREGERNERRATVYHGRIAQRLFTGNFVNTCSVLLKREVIVQTGEFDQTLDTEEDYDYWLRVANKWPLTYVDAPLTTFRIRPDQLTRPEKIERVVRNVLFVVQRASTRMPETLDPGEVKLRFARLHCVLGVIALRSGRNIEARRYLRQSLHHRPWRPMTLALYALTFIPPRVSSRLWQLRTKSAS
jgi:glycosyltransferase involved in cell wall biosynthesis